MYDQLVLGRNGAITADFIGRGNIWIDDNPHPSIRNAAIATIRHLIYMALSHTGRHQLSVTAYDSYLTGTFAPFFDLSSEDSGMFRVLNDRNELNAYLRYAASDIVAVQNAIKGRAPSLTAFRREQNAPVDMYKLIVLIVRMSELDGAMQQQIRLLMQRGPENGISFLILSELPGDHDVPLRMISNNITVLKAAYEEGTSTVRVTSTCRFEQRGSDTFPEQADRFRPVDARTIISSCAAPEPGKGSQAEADPIEFSQIYDQNDSWVRSPQKARSSANGVTFCVGQYGGDNIEVTIGDEKNQRHNALITGAVGQGKSNLLSVIVHGLALNYPPEELQLYLLDFKEGVTFKPYANIDKEDYLPHAVTLGLECDVNFGVAVMEGLYAEYMRRMQVMKDHNVKSLNEFRRTGSILSDGG